MLMRLESPFCRGSELADGNDARSGRRHRAAHPRRIVLNRRRAAAVAVESWRQKISGVIESRYQDRTEGITITTAVADDPAFTQDEDQTVEHCASVDRQRARANQQAGATRR